MTSVSGAGMALDTEITRAPALRISNIVRSRTKEDGRVRYFVDPDGLRPERAIPEDVVLTRWRRRVMEGHSFHGCRLGPNLWRAVSQAFGMDVKVISGLEDAEIAEGRRHLQLGQTVHHLWLPEPNVLGDLFALLGPSRLDAILGRHNHPNRASRFGTPDLFLFARETSRQMPSFFRLVEVKRPKERISKDQHDEIAFLRSIGIPARVLRLAER